MIDPKTLLELVENTAPWIWSTGPSPFCEILKSAPEVDLQDPVRYFALCLAAHHATVATYVPTDVDSKIRGLLWRGRTAEEVERMVELAFGWMAWDQDAVSARVVHCPEGNISGLDGERLSVLAGALLACHQVEREDLAARVAERLDAELAREAAALRSASGTPGRELDALALAAILTHNAGDVDQGISFWPKTGPTSSYRPRFARLAHENVKPYGGAFHLAAEVYKQSLSPEGHRNYPLRGVRSLRKARDLLLPISPFLDDWGTRVATHAQLDDAERGEVLAALLSGSQKLGPQLGYYRAMAGMAAATSRGLEHFAPHMPAALRRAINEPEVRRHLGLRKASFESSMRKRSTALFGTSPAGRSSPR